MSFKYFKNPAEDMVYGYDPVGQEHLIEEATAKGWEDITSSWPPPADPEPPREPTPAEKLANAGLTVDELKSLLGL